MTLVHRLASCVVHRRDRGDTERNAFVEMAAGHRTRDGATPAAVRRMAVFHLGGVEPDDAVSQPHSFERSAGCRTRSPEIS